ncbi:O-antigen ligase family protein [Bdellovibrio svalbardensis]|uniref:O-antigen ligase family protein n=1 Tax=Bdellovibrio svalbardensis TaxID=2972972 RepID=A0ABT6DKF7_9BACT|nr:O-antigen ligase family protein [Bdellovibrio svalbardensis]MDG0817343.1 O-antigen ligase family protein [Bdellovibrio svalbardensis]
MISSPGLRKAFPSLNLPKSIVTTLNSPILGIVLWLSTIFMVSQIFIWSLFLFIALSRYVVNKRTFDIRQKWGLYTLLTIALANLGNQLLGGTFILQVSKPPFYIMYIFTFIAALQLNKNDLRFFLWLVCGECLLAIVQFLLGINSFFFQDPNFRSMLWEINLYSGRVIGLSDGIPSMGYKLFVGIILISFLKHKENSAKQNLLGAALLMTVLLLNFHRSSILGTILFLILFSVNNKSKMWIRPTLVSLASYVGLLLLRPLIGPWIISQIGPLGPIESIQHGNNVLVAHSMYSVAYRDEIFSNATNFIKDNLLFGNHSVKYSSYIQSQELVQHAHNSFLQIFATSGVVIGLMYLFFIGIGFKLKRYTLLLPFLVISMTQYGIFWGISFLDIFFLAFVYSDVLDTNSSGRFFNSQAGASAQTQEI